MKLNGIFSKLRKKNKKEYLQFQFCITLSILLISSYLMMYGSPLVQNTLPAGGDSRKIADMVFFVAAAGCIMFSIYSVSLFLRYKSRETGVLLALGAGKGQLAKALSLEMGKMLGVCGGIGIAGGIVLSSILGNVFEQIASSGNDNEFGLSAGGAAGSVLYCLLLLGCVAVMCIRFMKRSNIIDIINEQRKQEPIKKLVTPRYLAAGFLMIGIGLLVGFFLPIFSAKVFKHWMGMWTNVFYIFILWGLYRVMVYSISSHRKGKNPQNYYKRLISYGMLKFQGGSIVKNMLVIALLLMGGLFGLFYVPLTASNSSDFDSYEREISYWYPESADEITREDVAALEEEFQVKVEDYQETEFIQVLGDGINRDDLDENGNLLDLYCDKRFYYECISATAYSEITGIDVEIGEGHYRMILPEAAYENVYNKFGDISKFYKYGSEEFIPMTYDGEERYQSLSKGSGNDTESRFVINDTDYEKLKSGLSQDMVIRQVLFNLQESDGNYKFTEALYKEFCERAPESMNHLSYYDAYQESLYGEEYGYAGDAVYDGERPALEADWKYGPVLVPLMKEHANMSRAVFLLLFIYIALICLVAQSIIAYTRSQNIALRNRQVFGDLEKLGADHAYMRKLVREQVKKVFVLPVAVGCILIVCYLAMVLWQNDGMFKLQELKILAAAIAVSAVTGVYQYGLYRKSLKKAFGILGLG